jgi:signal transduction histidine kinase
MWDVLMKLFSGVGFMPHGHCFLWTPGVLWTYVVSDTIIACAYYSIPLSLWYFLRKRADIPVPFSWLASLFAVFIFACGTTHLMGVIDIWNPLYRLDASIKALTGAASILTAIFLYTKMPLLLSIPSRAELEQTNARLHQAMTTRDELEQQLQNFNRTLERRIQERTTQLERLNEELRRESLERLRAEQQARHLNATLEHSVTERTRELELANQELASFSYSVAHDMRAPLRAIGGFAEMLKEEMSGTMTPDGARYIERISDASGRMSILIDSMLELSRVTRSTMTRSEVDLSRMAQDVIDTLKVEQPRDNVSFTGEALLLAQADPKYLRIVLENLLGNAWKYTSKTSQAAIEFGRKLGQSGELVWFVRDNGAGFDMEHAANKLFQAFHRLHSDQDFPGTGVGLATVHRIITKHGGHIWAEAALGQGATFFFTLGNSVVA